jgi:DNA invertase Pin-like site-specific DNA recombinase
VVRDIVQVFVGDEGLWATPQTPEEAQGAIAWARVSTDEQEEKGLSIPGQLREIRVYAERRGIEIVHEFQEAASAFRDERKRVEFSKMLATAKSDPRVTLILVHDFSRFSRDSVRAKALVCELRTAGVQLVSLNEPMLDAETPVGVYIEAITFAKNEAYSREIAFHTRKGCRANVQTRDPETGWCYKNGARPLPGYRAINVQRGTRKNRPIIKRMWELDDAVVSGRPVHEWVHHCLVELAGNGASFREIRDFCEGNHLAGERGEKLSAVWWAGLSPSGLLQYCGHAVYGVTRGRHGPMVPAAEWVVVPNAHPAIISHEEALSIAATRHEMNNGAHARGVSAPYCLAGGLFRCGRCGWSMVLSEGFYVCSSKRRLGRRSACASSPRIRVSPVESDVAAGIGDLLATLSGEDGVVHQINRELMAAWRKARRLAVEEQEVAAHPDGSILPVFGSGFAGTGVVREDSLTLLWEEETPDVPTAFAKAPRVSLRAAAACRRRAGEVLASADWREHRRLFRQWTEAVVLDPKWRSLQVSFRIPDDVILPAGAGEWCVANSPTLRALTLKTCEVRHAKQWLALQRRSGRLSAGPPNNHR